MTLAEYENASRARRHGDRATTTPLLMLFARARASSSCSSAGSPSARHDPEVLFSAVVTNLALAGSANGSSALVGWQSHALIQGTPLVAGRAIAAWTLHIQHLHEHTYCRPAGEWNFELARAAEQAPTSRSRRRSRAVGNAWAVGNANCHHVHPSAQGSRIPPSTRRTSSSRCSRTPPVVTIRNSIDAPRLKLSDEERGWLVGYPARRARPAAATELVEEPLKIPS